MGIAIFVAIVFVALMRLLKDPPGVVALVLGIAYGLGLWALQRYVTLPISNPRTRSSRPEGSARNGFGGSPTWRSGRASAWVMCCCAGGSP